MGTSPPFAPSLSLPRKRGRGTLWPEPPPSIDSAEPRDVWCGSARCAYDCALSTRRFEMARHRRHRRADRLAGAGAAGVPAVAERAVATGGRRAGAPHARQFPRRLFQRRDCSALPELAAVLGRVGGVRAGRRHHAGIPQRAHQYALQDAVLRAGDRAAGDPRHPVHGVVDHAGESEDRTDQSRAASVAPHRDRVRQHLQHDGDDLRRRAALFADGIPADDSGVPRHGPGARGIGNDERCFGAAGRAPHYAQARMAGGVRRAADPVRALDRIVRGAGAARAAGRHPRLYVVDLRGDPPVSEPDRARRRLRGDAPRSDVVRHLCAGPAVTPRRALRHRHRQGLPAAHHRPRRLASCRGGVLRALLHRYRAAAVLRAGLDFIAEILQRAVLGGAVARESRRPIVRCWRPRSSCRRSGTAWCSRPPPRPS